MQAAGNPASPVSILLVEDEAINLDLLATLLARRFRDVEIHTANNGGSGLELFREHHQDIVITDVKMPVMGGVQMIEKIRAIKPGTKFIIITADTGKTLLHDSIEKGFQFDHFILKPVDAKKLFVAIEQCLQTLSGQAGSA